MDETRISILFDVRFDTGLVILSKFFKKNFRQKLFSWVNLVIDDSV